MAFLLKENTHMGNITFSSLLRKKNIETPPSDKEDLARVIGMPSLIFFGVGGIVGTGLFSITGVAASEHAGPAVIISFFIGAIACAFIGLCYSELAGMITVAGSSYSYTYIAYGEIIAWMVGWNLVLEYAVGAGAVAVSWSKYMMSFLEGFHIHIDPRYIASPFETVTLLDGSKVDGIINLPSTVIVVILSLLLIKGLKESLTLNNIVVVIKICVILTLIAFGLPYIKAANFVPFIPENTTGTFGHFGFSGIMQAAGMIIFAYIGFDSVSSTAQEVKNPSKNIPKAILIIISTCAVIYFCFAFVIVGLVYYTDLLNDAAPVATAIDHTPFKWLQPIVKISILFGYIPILFLLLIGQTRIFFSLAKDGLIPKFFAKTHPKFKTPHYSHTFFMVFVCILSAFFPIGVLGNMCAIGALFAFVFVCLAVVILRKTYPDYPRTFKIPGGPIIPIIGSATALVLMYSLNNLTWIIMLCWMALGLIIYFGYGYSHSKLNQNTKLKVIK
ncbi:Serine transporter YbeC [Commensalibacter communis]|uniref:Amino acid:H+ symporter family (PotE) n=2 Tax=Commensalibacter communis TaxID=2972786 RepID=A0A9W4TM73_9PROT|nr:Serine transporter YbeC [Commensalibacter communis]CAI3929128.1 Serine transporter YbeC [Commensalibacter communis]CAI3932338.1 Serine transporter YbeC [Commensalibacter communis]CAI3933863.1 Serine transporter YbeC [Commensalibacter communis]